MKTMFFNIKYFAVILFMSGAITLSAKGEKDSVQIKLAKEYKELLKDAKVSNGLFNVLEKEDDIYFELGKKVLGQELLVVSRLRGAVKGMTVTGGAGMKTRPPQVVRWEKHGNKVMLRSVSYDAFADPNLPIQKSVKRNNFEPVVCVFPIVAKNSKDSSIVIKVTELFTTEVDMISPVAKWQISDFGLRGVDRQRSFVTGVKAFPKNVEIKHVLTYRGGDKLPANALTATLSVEMNQSFVELPKEPMRRRMFDHRVGYFRLSRINYGLDAQKAKQERFITKWRLEPVDMAAWKRGELVEVKKPIVYYLDPSTPVEWREPIKRGVNAWQKAFEAIGLKNAIMAKDAPTKEENPDWSPEDVRYSVIRYVASEVENAEGPSVYDPRTGEILESDIMWHHNVLNLLRNWYFVQTAAVNKDAQNIQFSNEVMGRLVSFIATHEVGHTLGLAHNMGASPAYSVDSLRAPGFVQKNGTSPSIMDYARFNYVAQPEDVGAGLLPSLGAYDYWAIKYGYMPIPEAKTMKAESFILKNMVKKATKNRLLRFGMQQFNGYDYDPTVQMEDLGDNPVYASELGIKNLKRIVSNLVAWTKGENEQDFSQLTELYNEVLKQFKYYLEHVSSNIAGVYEYKRSPDEGKAVFELIPKERQIEALKFLNRQIFTTPKWLVSKDVLTRISPLGASGRIEQLQSAVLNTLLDSQRLNRLVDQRVTYGNGTLGIDELFGILTDHIFRKEAMQDICSRSLQYDYIEHLGKILKGRSAVADVKAQVHIVLIEIQNKYNAKKYRSAKTIEAGHILELNRLIDNEINK